LITVGNFSDRWGRIVVCAANPKCGAVKTAYRRRGLSGPQGCFRMSKAKRITRLTSATFEQI
jgi:hypothetical protein